MAVETAEPPPTAAPEYIPPQAPPESKEPLKVNRGELWKKEFAKLQLAEKQESGEADVPKPPTETPKEEPKPEVKPEEKAPEPELKPAAKKPESPLDAITAEEKPKEEPDELSELDKVQKPASEHWNKLKEIAKISTRKAKDLESELSKLKEAPKAQPDEILAITKERDEIKERYAKQEEKLKALNYQYSEDFQKLVADRDSHAAKIQARVERYGGDSEKVMAALSMPDGRAKNAAIKEALGEIDSEDRLRIHTLIEGLDEKNEKLAEEARNSSSRWDEVSAKREAELAEESAKSIEGLRKDYAAVVESLRNEIPTMRTVPDDVAGAAEWNESQKKADEDALRVLTPGGATKEESIAIARMGAHYKFLMEYTLKQGATIREQAKRLAEYDSNGPDFRGGDKPKITVKDGPGSQRYHKALSQIQAASEQE